MDNRALALGAMRLHLVEPPDKQLLVALCCCCVDTQDLMLGPRVLLTLRGRACHIQDQLGPREVWAADGI